MIINKMKRIKWYMLLCSIIAMLCIMTASATSHNVTMDFIRNWQAVAGNNGVYGPLPMIKIDNQVAWCLQANKALETGENNQIDFTDIGITEEKQKVLSLIANFGYYNQPSEDHYALTQNLIWEYLGDSDYYVSEKYPTRESQKEWKEAVMLKVKEYQKAVSFQETTHVINVGQTITLTDTNGVLKNMEIVETDGLDVSLNGNTLTVTGTIGAKDKARIKLQKKGIHKGTNFVVRKGNSQAVSVLTMENEEYNWLYFDVQKYIDVNLLKVDADTGTFDPQGDASLIGAEYSLYTENHQLLETKVVGETGQIRFEKLWVGKKYYIKETKAPIGYMLSEESITIDPAQIISGGEVKQDLQWFQTVREKVMKQAFSIIKISTDGESGEVPTLQGAEFTVKLEREVQEVGWEKARVYDTLITDTKGYALSKELPFGEYRVKETKTPENVETVEDFMVTINQDSRSPQVYRILNDGPFEAYVKLVKRDRETGALITFSKASFQLYDSDGNLVKQKVGDRYIDTFTTDATGVVITPLPLKVGNYYIHEIEVPTGYLSLPEPIEIEIKKQGVVEVDPDGDAIITVTIPNERPVGKIVIKKSFEEAKENTDFYATFKVVVNTDIINPSNGEIEYKKGDVIPNRNSDDGLYETDEQNQIVIADLPLSIDKTEYRVIEVETSLSYQLIKDFIVTFEQKDEETKEYVYEKEVENKLTEVQIRKEDAISKKIVSGATLQVLDGNKVIQEWITTDTIHTLRGLERGKEYTLHEVTSPTGYLVASDIPFTVDQKMVVMKDHPILTDIAIIKVEANTQKKITGLDFVFTLYADKECTKEIMEKHSNPETGIVIFPNIKYGTYYIKETKAPDGYQLSNTIVKVEIDATLKEKIQEIRFENKRLAILKTGDTTSFLWQGVALLTSVYIGNKIRQKKVK